MWALKTDAVLYDHGLSLAAALELMAELALQVLEVGSCWRLLNPRSAALRGKGQLVACIF